MSTHGLISGYVSHKRRGEQACTLCKVAWAAYYRARRLKKKGLAK